ARMNSMALCTHLFSISFPSSGVGSLCLSRRSHPAKDKQQGKKDYALPAHRLLLLRSFVCSETEDVGGKIGEFAFGKWDLGHRMLRKHDGSHYRSAALIHLVGDFRKTRDIDVGLFLSAVDEVTIGAEASC